MPVYSWEDWGLGVGIVLFVIGAGYVSGFFAIVPAALAAACAYAYGVRAPSRRTAEAKGAASKSPDQPPPLN